MLAVFSGWRLNGPLKLGGGSDAPPKTWFPRLHGRLHGRAGFRFAGFVVAILHASSLAFSQTKPANSQSSPTARPAELADWREFHWGISRAGTPLVAWEEPSLTLDPSGDETRVFLVGGLDRQLDSTLAVRTAVIDFARQSARQFPGWRIAAIPAVFPPANSLPENNSQPDNSQPDNSRQSASAQQPAAAFPPPGPAYQLATLVETQYLWRFLGQRAPDLVIDVRAGDALQIKAAADLPTAELAAALSRSAPAGVGTIPALQVTVPKSTSSDPMPWLPRVLETARQQKLNQPSAARRELQRRHARTPLEVARQLSTIYGHDLPRLEYIPTTAIIGRIYLGQAMGDRQPIADAERLLQPYLSGALPTTPQSGSGQAGHLLLHLLATVGTASAQPRYRELVEAAAKQMFQPDGTRRELMPFHNEMSDALYMGGPILAAAGQLAHAQGDRSAAERYYDACLAHLTAMRKLVLRPDGLYRHSPLDEAAWGRGNGFPAIGLTLSIDLFPTDDARRATLIAMAREHFTALLRHQDADGMWHQVIDRPESYRELSSTCMIGWALHHARRQGWLTGDRFSAAADSAWQAARLRIASDGQLLDVCTGTGKQPKLRDYYDREALLGKDPRGGAFALLIAVERLTP